MFAANTGRFVGVAALTTILFVSLKSKSIDHTEFAATFATAGAVMNGSESVTV